MCSIENQCHGITIFVHNDVGFIWTAREAIYIRYNYQIIGSSVGSISEFRSQNRILGLPFQLSLEEIMLAIKLDSVRTVQSTNYEKIWSTNCLNFKEKHDKHFTTTLFGKNISTDDGSYGYTDYEKFCHPREKKTRVEDFIYFSEKFKDTSYIKTKKRDHNSSFKRQFCIQLVPQSLYAASRHVVWPSYFNSVQRARCAVLQDLHSLGYSTTDGTKFGGDFLAYPGDPDIFHAKFVVRILTTNSFILPHIITAHARTSHSSRKHLIIAFVSDNFPSTYQTNSSSLNKKHLSSNTNKTRKSVLENLNRKKRSISGVSRISKSKNFILMGNHLVSIDYITFSSHLARAN
jgi:tRNA-splicing endonuclease subunit Sen34